MKYFLLPLTMLALLSIACKPQEKPVLILTEFNTVNADSALSQVLLDSLAEKFQGNESIIVIRNPEDITSDMKGMRYLLSGSLTQFGEKIIVTARIIKKSTGEIISTYKTEASSSEELKQKCEVIYENLIKNTF